LKNSPPEETDLTHRVSFGKNSEDEEFRISSKPVLSYSDKLNDSNNFGLGKNTQNKSQKYMKNVKMGQNQYLDVQDVIRENKKHNKKLL